MQAGKGFRGRRRNPTTDGSWSGHGLALNFTRRQCATLPRCWHLSTLTSIMNHQNPLALGDQRLSRGGSLDIIPLTVSQVHPLDVIYPADGRPNPPRRLPSTPS